MYTQIKWKTERPVNYLSSKPKIINVWVRILLASMRKPYSDDAAELEPTHMMAHQNTSNKLSDIVRSSYEPCCEKTGLRGFPPGLTQTRL